MNDNFGPTLHLKDLMDCVEWDCLTPKNDALMLCLILCTRCNMSTIMLEMDRILRPGGHAYIRDSVAVMDELQDIGKAMGWHVTVRDTSEGPHASYKILVGDKHLLRGKR